MRQPLLPIFLTVLVDVLALTIILPLLPFYADSLGATPIVGGLLTASFAVCQLISGPILGRLSDRVGRKRVLLVSQMGTCIGFLVLGSAHTLWMLFLGRIIDGLTAGNLSIAQAYISDVTKPEERTKSFALIGIAFGMGFLIGPAISGVMAHKFGYSTPPFAAAALSLTSVVFTATLLPNVRPAGDPADGGTKRPSRGMAFSHYFGLPGPRRHLLEFFAFVLSFTTITGGLALFLKHQLKFDVQQTGYVYAFSGLVGAIIQGGLIGRLVKRLGEAKLTLFGFASMAAGYVLLGFAKTIPFLLVLVAISGFGVAVVRPSVTTMLTKSVGRHEQGAALGVSQSLQSIASIVGPICAGFFIEHEMLVAYGLMAATFALVGVALQFQQAPSTTTS